jgi:hypothetical protein
MVACRRRSRRSGTAAAQPLPHCEKAPPPVPVRRPAYYHQLSVAGSTPPPAGAPHWPADRLCASASQHPLTLLQSFLASVLCVRAQGWCGGASSRGERDGLIGWLRRWVSKWPWLERERETRDVREGDWSRQRASLQFFFLFALDTLSFPWIRLRVLIKYISTFWTKM